MNRLLIVTDAWDPQTNGVVTTLKSVIPHLPHFGYEVQVLHPGFFDTWPLPSYPEILLARNPLKLRDTVRELRPDSVHIATEGPLGMMARSLLCRWRVPFTTSLHTKFPEYINERIGLPLSLGYRFIRWFHRPAAVTLCTTASHKEELEGWGLRKLVVWGRGVDTGRFRPSLDRQPLQTSGTRPRLLYVGRVAVEKNIGDFLSLPIDAEKVVVGDGPARAALQKQYPAAIWLGYRHGEELVREYAKADVFVFPSRTDTFGLVMLESMACGTPVAAYPVTGPRDIVVHGINGCLNENLLEAVRGAFAVQRSVCRSYAETQDWRKIAQRMAMRLNRTDWSRGPARPLPPPCTLKSSAAREKLQPGKRGA
jgi:glycosyltransferase involved in cell wall biosynthesis